MKKQLFLAVAAAAGISASASAGILSTNDWSVLYEGETLTLSANARSLYFRFFGSATPPTGETLNVTQFFADGCDASGNNCAVLKNYTLNCSSTVLGDPGTLSTLLALTVVSGASQPFVSTTGSPACSITFGSGGEVTSGWVRQDAFFSIGLNENVQGVQLWGGATPRRTIVWSGPVCDDTAISDADVLAAAQQISDDYDTQIAAGPIGPFGIATPSQLAGTDCSPLSVVPFSLGYCDPLSPFSGQSCQTDLAKAVPVPAFAAAALGLGLMGITYLTSRRRKVS